MNHAQVSSRLVDDLKSLQPEQVFDVDIDMPGYYVFGNDNFHVLDLSVTDVLHRSFTGSHEDFVLGVISVLLIALLSEIVQTVLMRTRKQRVSKRGLRTAVVLDEMFHFRNVWHSIRPNRSSTERRSKSSRRMGIYYSLLILGLASALMAAEVFAVYLTQPKKIYASPEDYNLMGQQPGRTTEDTSVRIDHLTKKRRCVTPSMKDSNQTREYSLNACIMRDYTLGMMGSNALAKGINVSSWYHEAGSDHDIAFWDGSGDEGGQKLETRAYIMVANSGMRKGLRFRVTDNKRLDGAKYLQRVMIHTAMQWHCDNNLDERSCDEIRAELKALGVPPSQSLEKNITLWKTEDGGKEIKTVRGVSTFYQIEMKNPFGCIESALRVFATSAFIREVTTEPGRYVNLVNGTRETTMENLVSEEGRVAGLVMLCLIFAVLLCLLILLRIFLHPVSLAKLARTTIEDDVDACDDSWCTDPSSRRETDTDEDLSYIMPSMEWRRVFFNRRGREREMVTDLADYTSDTEEDYQSVLGSGSSNTL